MVNREAFDILAGNENVKAVLSDYIEYGKIPHAVLISGREGTGKHTAALILAQALGCNAEKRPCLKCEACRKIAVRISPDVKYITCEKGRKTIGVEAVRTIRESAYIIPNDLEVKIFIVSDASVMTAQAQNALLKLLEEPPENVYFILIASDVTALLTTVRSRAQEIRMETFSGPVMGKLLSERNEKARAMKGKNPELLLRIINNAQGSYGKALSEVMSGKNAEESTEKLVRDYITALSGFSKSSLYLLIPSLPSKQRDDAADFCEKLMYALRDMAAAKKDRNAEFLFFVNHEDAREAAMKYPFDAIIKMYREAETVYNELSRTNVNILTEYFTLSKRLWLAK